MINFNKKVQAQFAKMQKTGKLFRVELSGRAVWDLYLKSFKDGDDPTFRDPESSVHNCNHCNNFIRRYGNIVAIDENFELMCMFDIDIEADSEFDNVAKELSKAIYNSKIANIFTETYDSLNNLPYEKCKKNSKVYRLGVDKNLKQYTKGEAEAFGVVKEGEIKTFNHMFLDLDKRYVSMTGASIEKLQGDHSQAKDVFLRGMIEIPLDTLKLVRDLINQGSLLNGETHINKITTFIPFKETFDALKESQKDNWAWVTSYGLIIAKFKNELIGVLCSELAEGEELNKACKSWNYRVDPANYMKAVAPITETQKKLAQAFVEENGYVESFTRRLAVLDDIKADEIKHMNVGTGKIKEVSMFDTVKPNKPSRHKRNEFDGIEEVTIEKFMKDILPACASVEAYFENRQESNLVTMTTAMDERCKSMFKWDNPYSWTYNGNLAGKSEIKEAVKAEGGVIDGILNFRLAWNSDGGTDGSDLDAWAIEPSKGRIGFSTNFRKGRQPGRSPMSGQLDVDNTGPGGRLAVENITWNNANKMQDGVYTLFVHQYAARNSQGFKAEIEFNGETHEYTYDRAVRGNINVAKVTLKEGAFSIEHLLPATSSSKDIYGLATNNFHKVNLICLSPNHWGTNKTGNKHYFLMLEGCKADADLRSFHNENLDSELAKHRKVLEVLGAVNMITPVADKQLSGLGFNATVKDEVILRLGGNFKRTVRVKF